MIIIHSIEIAIWLYPSFRTYPYLVHIQSSHPSTAQNETKVALQPAARAFGGGPDDGPTAPEHETDRGSRRERFRDPTLDQWSLVPGRIFGTVP